MTTDLEHDTRQLDAVIEDAQQYLFDRQAKEGYWQGDLVTNPTMEAEHVMLTEFLGIADREQWDKIANYLKRLQLEDGSWNIYRGGEGDLSTTVECYFALRLIGEPRDSPHMKQAKDFILKAGGIPEVRVFTKIWLALFGIWDWEKVPAMPPELIYLPTWFPFNIYDFASWARGTVVPLLVVISEKPVHQVSEEKKVSELFPDSFDGPEDCEGYPFFSWAKFFSSVDSLLKFYDKLPWQPGRKHAECKCAQWIVERQEADGSWGGIQPPWVYSLIALHILEYPLDHPVMKKGIEGLDEFARETSDEWWLQACVSPVWDTAWGVLALLESGLAEDHPVIKDAAEWLVDQEVRVKGDWAVNAEEVEPGGWPFEFENETYPDVDDVALVLMALDGVGLTGEKKTAPIDRGFEWLLALQSSDGGWGAFDVDNDLELLYEIPFADFGAMIDPSTVDVTAHVLELFGRFGFGIEDQLVQQPLRFIRERQQPDGSWFGRWGVNYVYGTGCVLPALEAVGEDMSRSYVRRAVDWLVEVQNPDGGWGETPKSYEDPSLAGQGPSTPSQTAWAILALLAAGEEDSTAVSEGISFLVERQTASGTWVEDYHTGTGFPGDFYLIYDLYSHYFPLLALGRYQEQVAGG
ncbi:MAG: squalene--hopene cyclase [Candidatus Acetothermia bacterium]